MLVSVHVHTGLAEVSVLSTDSPRFVSLLTLGPHC